MQTIITDLAQLSNPAEQLEFIKNEGLSEEEGRNIMSELTEVLEANKNIIALAAPQIGINKRVFGIRFDDTIKFFINPIITKKSGLVIAPESFASMPNKEILIGRPEEITVIYYTSEFKYEDNKLIGPAARVFDQMYQVLDGVMPNELGLVSDITEDGSLADLSEDEIKEVQEIWKKFVKTKLANMEKDIKTDENSTKLYNQLRFTESVINGRTTVLDVEGDKRRAEAQNRAKQQTAKATYRNFIRGKK